MVPKDLLFLILFFSGLLIPRMGIGQQLLKSIYGFVYENGQPLNGVKVSSKNFAAPSQFTKEGKFAFRGEFVKGQTYVFSFEKNGYEFIALEEGHPNPDGYVGTFSMKKKSEISLPNSNTFHPIFTPNDSVHFNILILRFEDYIAGEDTYCIGRAMQENLNVIQANEQLSLPLHTEYESSISPPKSLEEAQRLQKQHNADLIIYGLARKVQEDCIGAEICFRYNIAEQVISQVVPIIQIKPAKHDLDYISTSPMALEEGLLQIDALSLKHWVTSLINVKAGKDEEAFLELDKIGNDTTLNDDERAKRFLAIGDTYSKLKQYPRAIKAFDKSISLNPNANTFYSHRGNAYYHLKHYNKAIQDYTKVIQLDFISAYIYNDRGNAYRKLGRVDQAIIDYAKAIELDSTFAYAYNGWGNAYFESKEYDKAIIYYTKAIQLDSSYAYVYNNLGNIYSVRGQKEKAIINYTKAIELDSTFAFAYNNRGDSYRALRQYDKAIIDHTKAIELDSTYANSYNNRGVAYKNLGQYNEAIIDYTKAIELDSTHVNAYNNRGNAFKNLGQNKKAIIDYDKAIELAPNYTYPYNGRGNAFKNLGQYRKAIQSYTEAIQLDSNYIFAFTNREAVYFELKQYRKAISDRVKVIEINKLKQPNNIQTLAGSYGTLSWYYIFAQQFKEAELAALEGLRIDSSQDWINSNLVLAVLYQGKWSNAKFIYSKFKNKQFNNKKNSCIEIFLQDLKELEEAGINHPDTEKAKVFLQK